MLNIPLTSVPNQDVSFNADGAFWEIHVFQAVDKMYMDISINGTLVISTTRCLGGIGVMPYEYLYRPDYGNFIFDSEPDWNDFGGQCNLYYLTYSEFVEYQTLLGQL